MLAYFRGHNLYYDVVIIEAINVEKIIINVNKRVY